MIFDGIEKYIVGSSQTRGRTFHVTMTYFWVQMVHLVIRNFATLNPSDTSRSLQALTASSDVLPDQFSAFILLNPYLVGRLLLQRGYDEPRSKSRYGAPRQEAVTESCDPRCHPKWIIK